MRCTCTLYARKYSCHFFIPMKWESFLINKLKISTGTKVICFVKIAQYNCVFLIPMKVFKYLFLLLYRIWFYVLVALPILVAFPILLISISKESWYPFFFKLARLWGKFILIGMGFRWKIEKEETPEMHKSYMFIANHTSMADIMLMLVAVKNPFVFVG